jgi:hypothetical protein
MSMRAWRRSRRLGRKIERTRSAAWESLEPRLAMTWAGVPPSSIIPPGAFTNVVLNANSDATGNASISSTEIDYYKFQATSTGPYVISAKTPSSNLNPILAVYSAAGARVAFNDDISSTNKDSQAAVNLQAGFTYYVGITNRFASSHGSYSWKIDGLWGIAPDDSYEQNDSFAAAADLGVLSSTTTIEDLVKRDSSDWYQFTTINTGKSTHYVAIDFEHRRGDLDIALYNDSGELLGRSRTRDNRESISLKSLAAGTYFVRVYGAQGAFSPNYSLTVRPPLTAPVLPPPQTDLQGNSIKITDDVNWDEAVSIQTTILNDGYTAAGAFNVRWFLSQDNAASADDILLQRTQGLGSTYRVDGVAANSASKTISVNLQLPEELPMGWRRNTALMYVIMQVDVNGEILETTPAGAPAENNNFGEAGPNRDHAAVALGRKINGEPVYNIDLRMTGLTASQKTIFKAAAHRWEQIIIGDRPDLYTFGLIDTLPSDPARVWQFIDDLLVDVGTFTGDGPGGNVAVADWEWSFQGIPFKSFILVDRFDLAQMEQDGNFYEFALLAVGRTLGLGNSPAWTQWLVQDPMTMEIFFTGPAAMDAFGGPVPVDPGFYWSEGAFGDEILTAGNFNVDDVAPISLVTIGSLIDMGYGVDPDPELADDWPVPAPAPSSSVSGASSLAGASFGGGGVSSPSVGSGSSFTGGSSSPGFAASGPSSGSSYFGELPPEFDPLTDVIVDESMANPEGIALRQRMLNGTYTLEDLELFGLWLS